MFVIDPRYAVILANSDPLDKLRVRFQRNCYPTNNFHVAKRLPWSDQDRIHRRMLKASPIKSQGVIATADLPGMAQPNGSSVGAINSEVSPFDSPDAWLTD
jgi:hypothetical protein